MNESPLTVHSSGIQPDLASKESNMRKAHYYFIAISEWLSGRSWYAAKRIATGESRYVRI